MKKRSYVLIIFLIFFVLAIVTAASFVYFQFARPPSVKSHTYLELFLSGEIQEKADLDLLSTLFTGSSPLSMYDIWTNFQKAKIDPRVDMIVLRLGPMLCDWAKAQEIRDLVLDFRKSGKKVYAYIDEALDFDKEYFLATACDKIILHPEGILVINGIGGYVPFVKKALDKLGIEAEVEHVEEYKTAYNMFIEDKLSPAHREMLESLYGNLYSHYVKQASKARGKSEDEFKAILDHGFFQGEKAKEAGLVDELLYEDQFNELLLDGKTMMYKMSHTQYLKTSAASLGLNQGKKIALIYGMGAIITGDGFYQFMGSRTMASWIRKARKDDSIAAIIFRVDSPGGSVVASDTIWREVCLAKKEKPFIVSMSDMAGSGGYQVSIAAHKIIAQPQTLTGSIGVIFAKFNMVKLYEKLGITSEKVLFGKRADMFSTFRKATPEERRLLKEEIVWTYDRFISKVAAGRNMSKKEVNKIGKGRVWTGSQAKELGLVDELGGLTRAVELAKELAGIPEEEPVKFVVRPKKISLMDKLFAKRIIGLKLNISNKVEKILTTFKLLEKEAPWALMPFWLTTE